MNKTRIAALVLGAGMIAAPAALFAQGPPPPPQGYGYGPGPQGPGGWDSPPREFRQAIQRQGFQDGMYGARKDFENHRRPTVMNRDEYRNYRGPNRRMYQDAFRRGYDAWWAHQGPRRPY
ncbi:MAG TPA: hypothetical protein VIM67_08920 [Terriglobus sp.]